VTALEVVADDGDARGVDTRYLVEASDGEEQVLVRVECDVFSRHTSERAHRWEKACRARKSQTGLAFRCCGVREGVAPGGGGRG